MRKERMNNKGFSLVELIIVIAIMAILAAALAPQLMKYIEKSRVSTDATTCTSIESCVNAALANEDIYKEVAKKASAGSTEFSFYITKGASGPKFDGISSGASGVCPNLAGELTDTLKSIKEPKQTGMNSYKVTIDVKKGTKNTTTISGSSSAEDVTEVGEIKVQTSAHEIS